MDKQKELNTIEGVIDARSVNTLGIKIGEIWYNYSEKGDKAEVQAVVNELGKGDKVKLSMNDDTHYTRVELLEKSQVKSWADEIERFNELLKRAHDNGFIGCDTRELMHNVELKVATFEATVYFQEDKDSLVHKYTEHGDASPDNIENDKVKKHYYRLAETRAIGRALRLALGTPELENEK